MNITIFDDKPTLDELYIKSDNLNKLSKINVQDLLHIIVYGNDCIGKTTQIYAFLASILDKKVYDLKNVCFEEDKKVMFYKTSIYHIEIDPIQLGSNEKIFMQSFLKYYIETKNICFDFPKIILIKNANLLLKQTQSMLRKYLDICFETSRFIFEVSNLSKFSIAIVSRCTFIRIKSPSVEEVKYCLINYSKKKNYDINDDIINTMINESNKVNNTINLKKIFGYYYYYIYTKKKFVFLYHEKFEELFEYINNKKISFVILQKIRDIVNELYINLVSMKELMLYLFYKILNQYKDNDIFINKILEISTECDRNLIKGNKDCIHLEYYIVSIIDMIHNS